MEEEEIDDTTFENEWWEAETEVEKEDELITEVEEEQIAEESDEEVEGESVLEQLDEMIDDYDDQGNLYTNDLFLNFQVVVQELTYKLPWSIFRQMVVTLTQYSKCFFYREVKKH